MKEISPGIFREGKKLYTKNLLKKEHREWDPTRSKLAAAVLNGLKENPIKEKSKILYLGASTGTTVSHVSDIANEGIVYAVEFAERVFRSLVDLSKQRKNIIPILADCRKPDEYYWVEECDIIYVDIAQPDQTNIVIRNAEEFLRSDGYLMIAVKSQSIDVVKNPEQVYKEEANKLKKAGFTVLDLIDLEPYEEKHAFILARK